MHFFQRSVRAAIIANVALLLSACPMQDVDEPEPEERWLAGDHHSHSRYSVGYDQDNLPAYTIGGDAPYPIPMNAVMARHFGLAWMVATDHGGPDHSKINFELAYPELQLSRAALPEVIQFYGLELNTPAADHSSIIVPYTSEEANVLRDLESRFDKYEKWTEEEIRERNQEDRMIEALQTMDRLADKPVVIANHPSRNAHDLGEYGEVEPRELRNWNDTAPDVAVGMEGAPGHQAGPLSVNSAPRGWYFGYPTMGGFDQMTAQRPMSMPRKITHRFWKACAAAGCLSLPVISSPNLMLTWPKSKVSPGWRRLAALSLCQRPAILKYAFGQGIHMAPTTMATVLR